jgi:hypothetical protein
MNFGDWIEKFHEDVIWDWHKSPSGYMPLGDFVRNDYYNIWEEWQKYQSKNNSVNSTDKKDLIYNIVFKFMIDNKISCSETIWQTDWVIEHAYDFIDNLYQIVKDDLPEVEW